MLWRGRRESTNVEDRRGMSAGGIATGGGILGVIALLLYLFFGGGGGGEAPPLPQTIPSRQLSPEQQAADDERAQFVGVVLADTEDVWNKIFADNGSDYPEPTLVLFRDAVQSACGYASAASGPFYCPGDQKLYIDLSFYEDMQIKLKAPGDFAMAYVIAHEVGHHVQTIMGTSEKMARIRQQVSEAEYNKYSVRMELQADFYAGVFAHYADRMKKIVEQGDIEEAMAAANAIGDDRLQKQSQGYVVPDAFTHGTSQQRMYWFKKGYETGDIRQGDTFSAKDL
jgi:predicted metalloprotease